MLGIFFRIPLFYDEFYQHNVKSEKQNIDKIINIWHLTILSTIIKIRKGFLSILFYFFILNPPCVYFENAGSSLQIKVFTRLKAFIGC